MRVRSRDYRGEEDYQRIRSLLMECYAISGTLHCWGVERLDWWRYNIRAEDEMSGSRGWEKDVHLWETGEGNLVGVVHPEGSIPLPADWADVFLEIHPHYRELEGEMWAWAEEHHAASKPDGAMVWRLETNVYDYDTQRAELLDRRGWQNLGHHMNKRRCSLAREIPAMELPPGYAIRTVGEYEMEAWAAVIGAAFGSELDTAERCRVWLRAPTRHFDLVAVAPDGAFASFCIAWFDEQNRIGMFEPVGTHPAHRQRGLGKAVVSEGLRWLQALGATEAYVGTSTRPAPNRLYESLGFTDVDAEYGWRKEF
jgi:GNAT superfamily N-acetyltransferase